MLFQAWNHYSVLALSSKLIYEGKDMASIKKQSYSITETSDSNYLFSTISRRGIASTLLHKLTTYFSESGNLFLQVNSLFSLERRNKIIDPK